MTSLFLLPMASPSLSAEETREKETKTVEKEKPAEPTPPPPKEEASVTDQTIKSKRNQPK